MARPKKEPEKAVNVPWFKVWNNWGEVVQELTDEQAGRLFKAMMVFSQGEKEPAFNDRELRMIWLTVKGQLTLDRQKYVNQVKSNSRAGKTSAETRKLKGKNNAKKLYQKNGVFEFGNADGTRDRQQVLTSVNEGRRKKEEGRRKEGLSQLVSSVNYIGANDESFRTSQKAAEILKDMGETLTLEKMQFAIDCIRDNKGLTDDQLTEIIRDSLADLPEPEDSEEQF